MVDEGYILSENGTAVCEKLPIDSRFAKKMMRGAKENPNMYVTVEQSAVLQKYVPTTRWAKHERLVYVAMEKFIDKTGKAPTVKQIAAMAQETSIDGDTKTSLTEKQVQKALANLKRRGIVFEMS